MSPTRRKLHFTAQLPPTPCTPGMHSQIIKVADERGVSIAEVQREAFSLFLSTIDKLSINTEIQANNAQTIAKP